MSDPKVYLAGPFFNDAQKEMIGRVAEIIEGCQYRLFSPWRDAGELSSDAPPGDKARIFQADVENLEDCDLVVAVLDWAIPGGFYDLSTHLTDPGTIWEIGYAYCNHKPIVSYSEDDRLKDTPVSLMLTESILGHAQGPLQLTKVLDTFRMAVRRAADEIYGEVVGKIRSEFPVKFEVPPCRFSVVCKS